MFLDNKYTKWYYSIVNYARTRTKPNSYTERHHIVPRCLGGLNSADNIVALTGREHFVCHILLTKMTSGNDRHKMIHAAIGMKRARSYQDCYINSRLYEKVKSEFAIISSLKNKGRIPSADTRQKMSDSGKGRPKSEEHKKKIAEANKGKIKGEMSAENKIKISNSLKGKPSPLKGRKGMHIHTDEAKRKISESNRRRATV